MKVFPKRSVVTRKILYKFKRKCNAHCDLLKRCVLPEKRMLDGKLVFKFLLQNVDKFDPNLISPLTWTNAMEVSYWSVQ